MGTGRGKPTGRSRRVAWQAQGLKQLDAHRTRRGIGHDDALGRRQDGWLVGSTDDEKRRLEA